MKTQRTLHYQRAYTLPLGGSCGIVGITPDWHIYAEEIYPPEDFLAQYLLSPDGTILKFMDEEKGDRPLLLPSILARPIIHSQVNALNYRRGRSQGMREAENITSWARPLSLEEKLHLIQTLSLAVTPMQILGITESAVLSSADLGDDWYVVCRRMRIAIALPSVRYDSQHIPYDYDSVLLQTAHLYATAWDDAPPLETVLAGLGGVRLSMPHDCVITDDKLYISENGTNDQNNAIHLWHIANSVQTE